jgi:hypothetical protein
MIRSRTNRDRSLDSGLDRNWLTPSCGMCPVPARALKLSVELFRVARFWFRTVATLHIRAFRRYGVNTPWCGKPAQPTVPRMNLGLVLPQFVHPGVGPFRLCPSQPKCRVLRIEGP